MNAPFALEGAQVETLDPRRILTSLGEIAYEWSLESDRLLWGSNFADVLRLEPEEGFATGADWEARCAPTTGPSRAAALKQAQSAEDVHALVGGYSLRYRIRLPGDSAPSIIVDDQGRWFAGENGEPVRAHGLVRLSAAAPKSAAAPQSIGARLLDHARFMDCLARACASPARDVFALVVLEAPDQPSPLVAAQLQKSMRASDIVSVCEDGAIAVLLRHCDGRQAARAFERFALLVENLRGGGAIGAHDSAGARTLLRRARQALAGVSPACPFVMRQAPSRNHDAHIRTACEEIVAALDEDRIFIALQPIVEAKTGEPAFFEALVRMRARDGAILGPADILPAAEDSGLVADLDQRVLELALSYLSKLAQPAAISVNVSGPSLHDPQWPARVEAALKGRETLARQLILEITETSAIADLDAAACTLARVRASGCQIAMDDFGAGHTSFRNLRALDIDIVKIDGAFVRNLVDSTDDQFFVQTLHDLARRIGARTVAEWVENADCASLLAQWGVDYLQGAYFGMPRDVRHDLDVPQ